jgi:hypothetical protein
MALIGLSTMRKLSVVAIPPPTGTNSKGADSLPASPSGSTTKHTFEPWSLDQSVAICRADGWGTLANPSAS